MDSNDHANRGAAEGPADADPSGSDLGAPADTEAGSLAALLGEVARAPATPPPRELAPGDALDAVYEIVRKLGTGGMGVVYLARDLELQREVAVKVHRTSIGTERLYREAVAMAQLAHPNVVTIHGVGRVHGRLFVAMEYVPGQDLAHWLAAAPRTWREVRDLMLAAGEGLAAAHAAGFIHRDIKPQNILVGLDHRPRVGDFGLVRVASDTGRVELGDEDPDSLAVTQPRVDAAPLGARASTERTGPTGASSPLAGDLTAAGATLGTPAYMAPEQFAGGEIDARADQFAFCIVLYEALYGRRPWHGATVAALRAQLAEVPAPAPTRGAVPAWLWPVLRRGLAAAPADRYPDMRALLAAIRRPPRRTAMMIGLAVGAVGSIVAGVAISRAAAGAPPCDAAGLPVIEAWGPVSRQRINAQYVQLDRARGPAAATQLAGQLDAWALRWQRAAVTACQAKHWSPAIGAASQRCLDASLGQLVALVATAERGDAIVASAATLPDVDACAEPEQLVGATHVRSAAIEGNWTGDFGHLVLRQDGGEIVGVYDHDDGTIRGTMIGDRFVGWWCEAPTRKPEGDAGDVEMQVLVDDDGVRAIAGRWRYGATGDWADRWDLTAEPGEPPAELTARFAHASEFCRHP
jgi:serine/threonine protein kinase